MIANSSAKPSARFETFAYIVVAASLEQRTDDEARCRHRLRLVLSLFCGDKLIGEIKRLSIFCEEDR